MFSLQKPDEKIPRPNISPRRHISTTGPLWATGDQEKLVDTNGAGDAFVGGFLAALSKGKDMEVHRWDGS